MYIWKKYNYHHFMQSIFSSSCKESCENKPTTAKDMCFQTDQPPNQHEPYPWFTFQFARWLRDASESASETIKHDVKSFQESKSQTCWKPMETQKPLKSVKSDLTSKESPETEGFRLQQIQSNIFPSKKTAQLVMFLGVPQTIFLQSLFKWREIHSDNAGKWCSPNF